MRPGVWECACLAFALAAAGCNGDVFVERAADQALLVVVGTDVARQAILSPAGGTATRVEGLEDGDIVATWSLSVEDFVLGSGEPIDLDRLNGVEARVTSSGDDASSRCPCADPGVESPAIVFDGQRCAIPRFVEPVSFRVSGGALVGIDDPSLEFSTAVRMDWPGACVGNDEPRQVRASEVCSLGADALMPDFISADTLGSVFGANGSGLVLVDPTGDRHERLVELVGVADTVELSPVDGRSSFVAAIRNAEDERGIAIARWDSSLPSAEAFQVEIHPRLFPQGTGDMKLLSVGDDAIELLSAEGGGDANAGVILRCEDLASSPRCQVADLGVCQRSGDQLRAGLVLPDGAAVAVTALGSIFTRLSGSTNWSCGPVGEAPITEIDGTRISARATSGLAWSGRRLVACFQATLDDQLRALVATGPFVGVDASGGSVPSNISWDVAYETAGVCQQASFTPDGRLAIFVRPTGQAQSALVEVDPDSGALIGVDSAPGLSQNAVLPLVGRPLRSAVTVGNRSYLLADDGALVRSSSVGVSVAYGRSTYEPAGVGAIARLEDRLFALTRGGELTTIDASGASPSCAALSTTVVTIPGFAPEDLPLAFALTNTSFGLVSIDTAQGAHQLLELDLDRRVISSSVDTTQRFIDIAIVNGDTFVLVDDAGGLASYHRGKVESLTVVDLPEGALWRAVSSERGLVWASGLNVLAQIIAGPPEQPGRLRVRPTWLELAGQTWTEREGIGAPELLSVEALAPWRAVIGGLEPRPSKGVLRLNNKPFILDLRSEGPAPELHEAPLDGSTNERIVGFGPEASFALGIFEGRRGLLHHGSEAATILPHGAPARVRTAGNTTLLGGRNGRLIVIVSE